MVYQTVFWSIFLGNVKSAVVYYLSPWCTLKRVAAYMYFLRYMYSLPSSIMPPPSTLPQFIIPLTC
jgi:hypothetical protein